MVPSHGVINLLKNSTFHSFVEMYHLIVTFPKTSSSPMKTWHFLFGTRPSKRAKIAVSLSEGQKNAPEVQHFTLQKGTSQKRKPDPLPNHPFFQKQKLAVHFSKGVLFMANWTTTFRVPQLSSTLSGWSRSSYKPTGSLLCCKGAMFVDHFAHFGQSFLPTKTPSRRSLAHPKNTSNQPTHDRPQPPPICRSL